MSTKNKFYSSQFKYEVLMAYKTGDFSIKELWDHDCNFKGFGLEIWFQWFGGFERMEVIF